MVQAEQATSEATSRSKATKVLPKVLVVDDVPENLELLEAILLSKGFSVFSATNGSQALELVESILPDVILLDVMMPFMDGFEVTRRIRSNSLLPYIPIVLVTALQDGDSLLTGLEAGADEFLTKPYVQAELIARVRALVRLKQSNQQLLEAAEENKRLNRLLQTENVRMSNELERTREAQLRLMPQIAPPFSGVSFNAYYNPALEVGGDYYDYFPLDERRLVVLVGDAVGKGGAAVLGVAITKSLIAAEFSKLAEEYKQNGGGPGQEILNFNPATLLARINDVMCSTLESSQTEITLWCGLVDLERRKIRYANAGHPFPYICQYRQGENLLRELKQGGLPLGLFAGAEYVVREVNYERGDRLVLYSDGITEGQNKNGRLFGNERLATALLGVGGAGPKDLCNKVLVDLDEFCKDEPQSDDRTLVIFGFY